MPGGPPPPPGAVADHGTVRHSCVSAAAMAGAAPPAPLCQKCTMAIGRRAAGRGPLRVRHASKGAGMQMPVRRRRRGTAAGGRKRRTRRSGNAPVSCLTRKSSGRARRASAGGGQGRRTAPAAAPAVLQSLPQGGARLPRAAPLGAALGAASGRTVGNARASWGARIERRPGKSLRLWHDQPAYAPRPAGRAAVRRCSGWREGRRKSAEGKAPSSRPGAKGLRRPGARR